MHVVLAFARDYDNAGKYQTGKFLPYFDTGKFNAEAMQNIKDSATSTSVKFFLSIGCRHSKFPFVVPSQQESDWIQNATDSLKKIVKDYNIDGIDVYYEHINSDAVAQFARSIQKVIWNLTSDKVITKASITVSAPVDNNYYNLYKENDKVFYYVIYQAHTEPSRIWTFKDLEPVFDRLPYPKEKVLAGHSDVRPSDCTNVVPPPIFLGAVPQLLNKGLFGISKWIVTPNDQNREP